MTASLATAEPDAATSPVVRIVSFGYLHGAPPESAHLTLDLRKHFRDPHVNPALRYLTAHDAPVRAAVLATPGIRPLLEATAAAIEAYLSGPSTGPVTVATGCAGGRHRAGSTAIALAAVVSGDARAAAEFGLADAAARFAGRGLQVELVHRDLGKPVVDR